MGLNGRPGKGGEGMGGEGGCWGKAKGWGGGPEDQTPEMLKRGCGLTL